MGRFLGHSSGRTLRLLHSNPGDGYAFSLQSGAEVHQLCACSRNPDEKSGLGPRGFFIGE